MNENTFEMIQKKERIKSFMMASLPTDVQFQIIKASESSISHAFEILRTTITKLNHYCLK